MALPPFQTVLEAHRRDVHRFLVASVGPEESDDCFQETFLSALRAYPKLRDASNLRGWLLTIAHHKALDAHRARARRPAPVGEVPEVAVFDEAAADEELWARVHELPPKQRAAVMLRFAGDLAYEEISVALGISADAARRNVHEGLKRMKMEQTT
ncbi:MAG: RNA polymerase sigma factor [Solirubrobacteraceae bacterium]